MLRLVLASALLCACGAEEPKRIVCVGQVAGGGCVAWTNPSCATACGVNSVVRGSEAVEVKGEPAAEGFDASACEQLSGPKCL